MGQIRRWVKSIADPTSSMYMPQQHCKVICKSSVWPMRKLRLGQLKSVAQHSPLTRGRAEMWIQASETIITSSPLCPWHFSSYTKKLTWKKGQKPRNKEKGMGKKREEKKIARNPSEGILQYWRTKSLVLSFPESSKFVLSHNRARSQCNRIRRFPATAFWKEFAMVFFL